MNPSDFFYFILFPCLILSLGLIFIRFLRGPRTEDRVVALDLIITIGIGVIAIFSVIFNQSTFLDIAMLLALIAFLGTVGFSILIRRRANVD
jgi:multicomponent Na+:H+ antiporter subunit F